jgi:hypothetical protein
MATNAAWQTESKAEAASVNAAEERMNAEPFLAPIEKPKGLKMVARRELTSHSSMQWRGLH